MVHLLLALQYIPRNMHTVFALLCFVVVIHWLIFHYPSGLLHWHCGNLTIAPVPAKQPWWIWINTSCEFIMNDCITTTKQSTTKPCAYFFGYTVCWCNSCNVSLSFNVRKCLIFLFCFSESYPWKKEGRHQRQMHSCIVWYFFMFFRTAFHTIHRYVHFVSVNFTIVCYEWCMKNCFL